MVPLPNIPEAIIAGQHAPCPKSVKINGSEDTPYVCLGNLVTSKYGPKVKEVRGVVKIGWFSPLWPWRRPRPFEGPGSLLNYGRLRHIVFFFMYLILIYVFNSEVLFRISLLL
jgi:hypothetical protein